MTTIVDLETLNNIINSNDLILIKKAAFELMQISDYKNAKKCFQTIYIANSKDLESYYNAAACSLDGTHKGSADARDILLEALENNQDLYEKKIAILPSYLPEPAAIIKAFAGRCVFFNAQIPFKFEKVEPEIIPQPNDKPPIIEDISLVVEESYVLHSKDKPLFVLR
jgi:hypothetical protein